MEGKQQQATTDAHSSSSSIISRSSRGEEDDDANSNKVPLLLDHHHHHRRHGGGGGITSSSKKAKAAAAEEEEEEDDDDDDARMPLGRRAWEENKKLWVVAGPSIFTRFSSFGVTVISQAFIGHIGATELAAYALVSTVLMRFSNGILVSKSSLPPSWCI
jgi:MATE family multidrug resistance protein